MTWVKQLKREYSAGKRKLEAYRERLNAAEPSVAISEELSVVEGMISDLSYAIEWMRNGRRPNTRRGIDIKDAYSRSIMMRMDLIPNPPPEQEVRITEKQKSDLVQILMRLSERERQCYLLHMAQGLSFAEIAKEVKLSRSSVQQYVERAKSKVGQGI